MDQAAYHHLAENEQSHWWFVARREFISRQLDKLKRPALKILEVGCGTGGNIDMLRGYGELSVMELDPYAIKIAESRHEIKVANGSLPDNHEFNQVSRMSNFFIFILPLALIRKFMGSVLKIRQTLEGQPPTLINNILKRVSIIETKISFGKGWPAGLSIYCELVPK